MSPLPLKSTVTKPMALPPFGWYNFLLVIMSSDIDEITITEVETETDIDSTWNVIVYDDPVNLMSFVTLILQRVFGYPKERAQSLMMEVHREGQSIVWTGNREQAELYVQQLQSYQLLAAMKRVTD